MEKTGLYLISNPKDIVDEATVLSEMLHAIPELVLHLRKPESTVTQVAEILDAIPSKLHSRIVLHYYPELLHTFGLKGFHFSPRHNQEKQHAISRSVHSINELRNFHSEYEYLFCSPVFDSISKPGYSGVDWNICQEDLKIRKKAVALGGIGSQSIAQARNSGFINFAVLGSVWLSKNPLSTLLTLDKILKNED